MTEDWTPSSWTRLPAAQQPIYADQALLAEVLTRLGSAPPVVWMGEVHRLRSQLAEVAEGRAFLLQGGDCAERFHDCNTTAILNKLKILLQMSLVLTYGARLPVVRVGRIAGQFAKPRSQDTELVGDVELPCYRGDNVNDLQPSRLGRQPDPMRLERGYYCSVATLNFVRALVEGGFASLRSPEHWHLDFIPAGQAYAGYQEIADRVCDAIDYLESLGSGSNRMRTVDFYSSHEGLLLPYEGAMTRRADQYGQDGGFYNLSAHFLWIGERTRALDGAHVEYFRGIQNPIGVKIGPSVSPEELVRLVKVLDPHGQPGRLTLITRFGVQKIERALPPLIRAVKESGRRVVWSSDPMHGNTTTVEGSLKTRDFQHIVRELELSFAIHQAEGSALGGVHFELTGDDVTECIGGAEGLGSADLKRSYQTGCDPRLNYAQSMEIALCISKMLQERRRRPPVAIAGQRSG